MSKLFKIHPADNVAVALSEIKAGYRENGITALEDIPVGHKILLTDLKAGEKVIKYGCPIGHISENSAAGSLVHLHNLKTDLSEKQSYSFLGGKKYTPEKSGIKINAYKRANGNIGIRNEIWIIPTVGCVNKTAQQLEKIGNNLIGEGCDGVFAFTHPYGCSQTDEDQENTRKILAALINHSNAGGVLVVSLGCENTNIAVMKKYLGEIDENRVKFLVAQESGDELTEGARLILELYDRVKVCKREAVGIENLTVGLKCGGSDAFSGITANVLCGKITDTLTRSGAAAILTETPEMFGAEHRLMARSESREVFDGQVKMISDFKEYFYSHKAQCYENPSPGNHDGGITTLEEKSLGCIQKGGNAVVTGVWGYGERCLKKGLNLLAGPGNDIVSTTNLACAGAHLILFTTGRGTPLGAPVPTIKISSNSALANKKSGWIDFDAGRLINGASLNDICDELLSLIIETANGKKTKNELNGQREIAVFKNGVTL